MERWRNGLAVSSFESPEDAIRTLFLKHVPEVASGAVEIMSVARDAGHHVFVAVRSNDLSLDPVSACLGLRGIYPKNMVQELGGEMITIVRWDKSPETFVLNALSPLGTVAALTPNITLDATARRARVEVSAESLVHLSQEKNRLVHLASRLVGWDIQLVADDGG